MLLDIMYRLRHESDRICIQVTSVALIQPARKLLLFVSHQSGTIYTIQPIRHFSRCVVLSALQGSSAVTVAPMGHSFVAFGAIDGATLFRVQHSADAEVWQVRCHLQ